MFSKLPLDLIEVISKYMHLFEYWNLRASCKIFRSICPAPQWRTNNELPLFLFFKNSGGSFELIDLCRNDSYSSILQSSPDPFTVLFSKDGWLLISVGHKSLRYFNLYTGVRGDFPPFEDYTEFRSIAFSTYPTCPDCLTVGIVATGDESVLIYYLESGKGTWNRCWFDDKIYCAATCNPIFLAGAFYFLDTRGYIGVFRLVDGIPSWQTHGCLVGIQKFFTFNLVECAGELYSVRIHKRGRLVQVYRFNDSTNKWVEITYFENHTLFISRASSFSIFSKDPMMRNRIYLPRFRGKKMVFYSLDTKKYHVLGSEDYEVDFYGTSEPFTCCWI